MSDLREKHPLYTEFSEDWSLLRDSYRGERVIKEKGTDYLPATPGQVLDGQGTAGEPGEEAYQAYKKRSVYPDFIRNAVEASLGVLHRKPPVIELPPQLEFMRENATLYEESLELLLRRINEEQLITGRIGMLLDLPQENPDPEDMYLCLYGAESIINWYNTEETGDLSFVILNESGPQLNSPEEFTWSTKDRYRVLQILGGQYHFGVFEEETYSIEGMTQASVRGAPLNKIPFVMINGKDIVPDPDDAPLIGLARLALSVYRSEADYRQNLFMQGQDTLVIIGQSTAEKETRVGAGATIFVPQGGDAKFIGVSATGLAEQRAAIENDRAQAAEMGGQLVSSKGRNEAAEALRIRVAGRTASLNQVALAGAAGLQFVLQRAAEWIGADPGSVSVVPNLDFTADGITGEDLRALMSAKTIGLPLSNRSIHERLREKEWTDRTFEEELEELAKEEPEPETETDETGLGPST